MIWELPVFHIAEKFNLTDNAIHRWIKDYNLSKPPQCYWARRNAGHSHENSLKPEIKITKPLKKFNQEQVSQIKELINKGDLTLREIAKQFNVCHPTISDIKNGKSYKKYLNPSVMGTNTSTS